MKKILKISVLLLAVGLIFSFTGCDDDDGTGGSGSGSGSGGVDFTSQQTASIRVRNNTNVRLVAFRGRPDTANLLGGVPANANNHGLSRDGFNSSADFVLTLVTETAYNAAINAGGNQALQSVEIFNVVYAFYNHTGTNNNIFQINAQSGGAARLNMENPTAWNIELRRDAHNGTTLGFIGPYTSVQALNLEPGDYVFYPVMRRFNPMIGEVIDVQPVFTAGSIANTPFFRELPITGTNHTWNFLTLTQNNGFNMVSGGAFVRVVNNSDTGISFFNGDQRQQTSGISFLIGPNGGHATFQIRFPMNPDGSFSATHTSNFGVGNAAGRTGSVPPRTVEIDWLYEIQVTGPDASQLTASELTPIQKMDIEGLFAAN
ncbi:MAG: hypothetical protein FWD26_11315 [Treponema sp.]|nr:hypothetical protein [Treponema sp.]